MKQTFSILCLLFLSGGCNKNSVEFDTVRGGDYDWVYSVQHSGDVLSRESAGDRFGIRVKKNGEVILFHDEKVFDRGEVKKWYNGKYSVEFKECKFQMEFSSDQLITDDYPINAIANTFKKI